MIGQLQRSSSWTGRVVVLAIALLGSQLHAIGAPELALARPGAALVLGTVMGLAMVAIVLARLFGKRLGLINSDRQAMFALVFMVAVTVVIGKIWLPTPA